MVTEKWMFIAPCMPRVRCDQHGNRKVDVYSSMYASSPDVPVPVISSDLTSSWYESNRAFAKPDVYDTSGDLVDGTHRHEVHDGSGVQKFRALGLVAMNVSNEEHHSCSFLLHPENLDVNALKWADYVNTTKAHDPYLAGNQLSKSNE
jgi:hypothetical protein